jgi:hypothetical protein
MAMGFRFRRTTTLIPGLRLNFSWSGVSASFGGPGAWLTIGRRGTRATFGLPGTGLSYTQQFGSKQRRRRRRQRAAEIEPPPPVCPIPLVMTPELQTKRGIMGNIARPLPEPSTDALIPPASIFEPAPQEQLPVRSAGWRWVIVAFALGFVLISAFAC